MFSNSSMDAKKTPEVTCYDLKYTKPLFLECLLIRYFHKASMFVYFCHHSQIPKVKASC